MKVKDNGSSFLRPFILKKATNLQQNFVADLLRFCVHIRIKNLFSCA
jgi:hypothetical protein